MDVPVATGYDPLLDHEPELARSMAASVRQRIAFGERAGEKVRRIGHGFGYEGERPELKGLRCATVNGFSLHANPDVAAPRRDQLERLLRYTARGAVSRLAARRYGQASAGCWSRRNRHQRGIAATGRRWNDSGGFLGIARRKGRR